MSFYFDASAFALLPLRDRGWEDIEAQLQVMSVDASLSDLTWGEFVSAVAMRVRRGAMREEDARLLIVDTAAWRAGWSWVTALPEDIAHATGLVAHFELGLRLPDAIHLAIATRLNATLVTTDRVQHAAGIALGMTPHHLLEQDT